MHSAENLKHLYSRSTGVFVTEFDNRLIKKDKVRIYQVGDYIPVSIIDCNPNILNDRYMRNVNNVISSKDAEELLKYKSLIGYQNAVIKWYGNRHRESNVNFMETIHKMVHDNKQDIIDRQSFLFGINHDFDYDTYWKYEDWICRNLNCIETRNGITRISNCRNNRVSYNMAIKWNGLEATDPMNEFYYVTCVRREYLSQYLDLYYNAIIFSSGDIKLQALPNPKWFKCFANTDDIETLNSSTGEYFMSKLTSLEEAGVEIDKGPRTFDSLCKPVNLNSFPTIFDEFDKTKFSTYGLQAREYVSLYKNELVKF